MIHSDNIPEPLKGARRWVVFRCIPQPDGSVKKIPLTVRGTLARCDNPIDWATLPEVLTAIEFCIGTHPAFVLGADYPLRVLDLDHCIDPRGNLTPLAVRIVCTVRRDIHRKVCIRARIAHPCLGIRKRISDEPEYRVWKFMAVFRDSSS